MNVLGKLEKALAELTNRRQHQEALVASLQKPLLELEELQQQEAAARTELIQIRDEIEQLEAERSDAQTRIDAIPDPAFFADLAARLDRARDYFEREMIEDIGIDEYTINFHAEGFKRIGERLDVARAIVARTTKRIKELGGT